MCYRPCCFCAHLLQAPYFCWPPRYCGSTTVPDFLKKGLVAGCHSFCLFFIFYNMHASIQSHSYNSFIRRQSLRPLSISSSLVCSVGNTSLWCQAENQTQACLLVSRHATNWATRHHKQRRTFLISMLLFVTFLSAVICFCGRPY